MKASRRFSRNLPLKDRHLLPSPKVCSVDFLGEAVLFVYERDSAPAEFSRRFLAEQGGQEASQRDTVRVQCISALLDMQPRFAFHRFGHALSFALVREKEHEAVLTRRRERGVAGSTAGSGASTWMDSPLRRR